MVFSTVRAAWTALTRNWRWLAPLPIVVVLSYLFALYHASLPQPIDDEVLSPEEVAASLKALASSLVFGAIMLFLSAWNLLNLADVVHGRPAALRPNARAAPAFMWRLFALMAILIGPVLLVGGAAFLLGAIGAQAMPALGLALAVILLVIAIVLLGVALYLIMAESALVLERTGVHDALRRGWAALTARLGPLLLLIVLAVVATGVMLLLSAALTAAALAASGEPIPPFKDLISRDALPTTPLPLFVALLFDALSFVVGAWFELAAMLVYLDHKPGRKSGA